MADAMTESCKSCERLRQELADNNVRIAAKLNDYSQQIDDQRRRAKRAEAALAKWQSLSNQQYEALRLMHASYADHISPNRCRPCTINWQTMGEAIAAYAAIAKAMP